MAGRNVATRRRPNQMSCRPRTVSRSVQSSIFCWYFSRMLYIFAMQNVDCEAEGALLLLRWFRKELKGQNAEDTEHCWYRPKGWPVIRWRENARGCQKGFLGQADGECANEVA